MFSPRGKAGKGEKRMGCHLSNVYINNVKSVLEMGGLETEIPLCVVDYNLYLVMDSHAAGCILLEDFCHPIGEPLILQFGLLLAVLLLVEKVDL